jgi:acyl carrier protein
MLGDIPKGPFGKPQRSRLADLLHVQPRDHGADAGTREYVAPRTDDEVLLAGMWARLLGVEVVGTQDDFFRLGGDSILATQLVSHVRHIMGVELSPIAMFETPTIAGLVRTLEQSRQNAGGAPTGPIKPRPRG